MGLNFAKKRSQARTGQKLHLVIPSFLFEKPLERYGADYGFDCPPCQRNKKIIYCSKGYRVGFYTTLAQFSGKFPYVFTILQCRNAQ